MNWDALILLSLKLLAVFALVALNGFFVAAEFAIVKIRDTQLDALIRKGQRRAQMARIITQNLNAFLSAAQLGITLASLALGWIGEPVFSALLGPLLSWLQIPDTWRHPISIVVGFTAITFLHISAGEQAPKSMAIQRPLATALWIAHPLHWFYRLSFPFIWILNHSSLWMLRQVGIEPVNEGEASHSEEELRLIISTSQPQTSETLLSRDLVLNALALRHRIAREVMRPRREIVSLSTQASIAECLEIAEKTRFSRFPLCDHGDLNKTLGTVHIKDLYAARLKARSGADLVAYARKLIYIPEIARLEKLLKLFLERKLHLAIVIDEYGGTVGMVTLENILEELVGQIQDEFDQEKPLFQSIAANTWDLSGALPLHQLAELIGEPLHEEGVTTVSGLVTYRLGGFPQPGNVLLLGNWELRVEEMDGLRVARLRLTHQDQLTEHTP
jgi:CBS domain containing-hemolysin-like protein